MHLLEMIGKRWGNDPEILMVGNGFHRYSAK